MSNPTKKELLEMAETLEDVANIPDNRIALEVAAGMAMLLRIEASKKSSRSAGKAAGEGK